MIYHYWAVLPRDRLFLFPFLIATIILFTACLSADSDFTQTEPSTVSIFIGGDTFSVETPATSVRELLQEQGIEVSESDIVDPPLFTPIQNGLDIRITRVTESIEFIERSIPFQRRTVRNASMSNDDPPIIVQAGQAGLQETTVRIVYHDGIEFSRQQIKVTIVEPARDEVVMVGVGLSPGNVDFPGQLAYISGGNSILLRGSSAIPEQINTGSDLDQRVFSLSPDGNLLLFSKASNDSDHFNSLWIVGTGIDDLPQSLEIYDVLWADWNPAITSTPQIAYTTGIKTELLPGWEANNDLWLANLLPSERNLVRDERIIESYPATYGWWGGNYAWSPQGRYIAFSYADEIGIIDTLAEEDELIQRQLLSFTEYNTRADWVWVPSLSWSPDGRFVAYTKHTSNDADFLSFGTWVIDLEETLSFPFMSSTGIWSHPHWSSGRISNDQTTNESNIAVLRATNELESQQSPYTLWLIDRDGSNARQIFPPAGENSRFPHDQNFMTWGPTGQEFAFVYNGQLYLFDLALKEAKQITHGDPQVSNPTWAPYGISRISVLSQPQVPLIFPTRSSDNNRVPID